MKSKVLSRNTQSSMPTLSAEELLREEAIKAKEMIDTGYMILARCLYDIYHQDIYSTYWNFVSFEDYIDSEIQITYRKAMYLVEIYGKAKLLNMDMNRLEKMGWSKARELIRIVDESNVEEWMTIAENSTVKELNMQVRQEKDKSSEKSSIIEDAPVITTITFKLGMAEHAIIDDALQESKAMINSDDLALAFANICQEWIEAKGIVPVSASLEDRVNYLEKIYGVKLAIVGGNLEAEDASDVEEDDEDEEALSTVDDNDEDDDDDSLDEFLK